MSTTMDQIHLLEKETIEEFRFLLNYRFDSESPMALVLVGQTELWEDKLRLKRYDAVRQRIDINCVLPHLNRAETEKYIQSHLVYAGIKDREPLMKCSAFLPESRGSSIVSAKRL
jgi:general secretion pathway protein A